MLFLRAIPHKVSPFTTLYIETSSGRRFIFGKSIGLSSTNSGNGTGTTLLFSTGTNNSPATGLVGR